MLYVEITKNWGGFVAGRDWERKENKIIKSKQTPLAGLVAWWAAWRGSGPKQKEKVK